MSLDEMRERYRSLFGDEPAAPDQLTRIERILSLRLPADLRAIAAFFAGGMLGGIAHFVLSASGPADHVTAETLRLRAAIGLPPSMLVPAEPPVSLIVLDTSAPAGSSAVVWCDATDAVRLGSIAELRSPQVWPNYACFFEFLLERELEDRAEPLRT